MESIFFCFFRFISIKSVISRFLLELLFWSRFWYRNLERIEHTIHYVFLLRVVIDGIRKPLTYLVQVPFMGEPGLLGSPIIHYHVSNLFVLCSWLHLGLVALKPAEENFFANFVLFSSHFVYPSFDWFGKDFVKHWLDLPCKHYLSWHHGRWSILIWSHSINLQKLLYGFIGKSISRFPKSSRKGTDETFLLTITSWMIRSDHDMFHGEC